MKPERDRRRLVHQNAQLSEAESRYLTLVQLCPDAVVVLQDERIVFINEAGVRLYGASSPDQILGCTALRFVPPEFKETVAEKIQKTLEGDTFSSFERKHIQLDGKVIDVQVSATAVTFGERPAVQALIRDITDQTLARLAAKESSNVLHRSESQLRLIWEKALDGMRLADENGKIHMVNEAFCKMVGLPREKLESQPISIVYETRRGKDVIRKHQERFQNRSIPPHLETDLILWNGKKVSFELSNSFLEFEGQPPLSLTIFRDITERKRGELRAAAVSKLVQKLSSCRNREEAACAIRSITEECFDWHAFSLDLFSPETGAYVPVLNLDTIEGKKVTVPLINTAGRPTARAQRVMQHGAELILKQHTAEVIDTVTFGSGQPSASIMVVPLHHGESALGVLSIQSYDENAFDTEDLKTLEMLAQSCGGALERIRAESALRHSEVRFQSVWENSIDGMRLTDENGIILAVNDAYCEFVGMKREELIGQPFTIAYTEKQNLEAFLAKYKERFRNHVVQKRTTRQLTFRDGRTVELEDTNSFVTIEGKLVLLGIFRDISAQKRLEEELRHAQKMESIGQLAGGIAHDFNNILTVISGHSALLFSDEALPAYAAESVAQISHASERAANLTRQLLAFSRKQVIQLRPLDLNEIVSTTMKMLQRVLGEDILLQANFQAGLPPVQADAGMMEQILLNLAVNSRDAMPQGGALSISTSLEFVNELRSKKMKESRVGQFACLRVGDTGCGIDPENLPKIFEPFFTTKDIGKGTGLGLATVYGIVKQHQGWIHVATRQSHGTVFEVFLPMASGALENRSATTYPTRRGGHETILVVEDQADVRTLVLSILKPRGYRCIEAKSAPHALEMWDQFRDAVDLVLTDVVMPDGMSGRALAEKLRQEKPGLKIIFTSGYPKDVLGEDLTLGQAFYFLQKPYAPQKLAQLIRACLDGKSPAP